MSDIVKGDFAKDGIQIGDMRAIALAKWFATKPEGASADEIKQEMARLREIMPAPEDHPYSCARCRTAMTSETAEGREDGLYCDKCLEAIIDDVGSPPNPQWNENLQGEDPGES